MVASVARRAEKPRPVSQRASSQSRQSSGPTPMGVTPCEYVYGSDHHVFRRSACAAEKALKHAQNENAQRVPMHPTGS